MNGETKRAYSVVEQGMVHRAINLSIEQRGEALYFDLGPACRPLIALLSVRPGTEIQNEPGFIWSSVGPIHLEDLYDLPRVKWQDTGGYMPATLEGWDRLARQRGARDIPPQKLPLLLTFSDVTDPKTILAVDRTDPSKALQCAFEWKRTTIEVTDEPVTTGIVNRLPWLDRVKVGYIDGSLTHHSRSLANELQADQFTSNMGNRN